jgi:peptide/nickel transport system substrate-binding protein
MKGHAIPTGTIAPPMINGYVKQLDRIPPLDLAKAKELVASAGFPDGFSATLNCPQGRYINDAGICQAIADQLAKIGITISITTLDRMQHLALIQKQPPLTDFYLMGFSVPTLDSEYELQQLFHSRTARAGQFNATRYSNADVDRMIDGLPQETDLGRRNQVIGQVWRLVHEETIYVPLHVQTLAYVMKSDLDVLVDIENQPKLKFVKFRKQQG